MSLGKVLHMNGGVGETSYANNSLFQQKGILRTKPLKEKVITDLYGNNQSPPTIISIADLGCSCGPNTLLMSLEIIEAIDGICRGSKYKSPEIQIFLNDLPGNDYNTLFQTLSKFQENLRIKEPSFPVCFFNGAPGSFYERLFATESIHFVNCSSSLHWLSRLPEGLEDNRGNIYITNTSHTNVLSSYYNQFQRDFSTFLQHRSVEIVSGGSMVLSLMGRKNEDPYCKESGLHFKLLADVINDLLSEGHIEEDKLYSFNIPLYTPSPSDIEKLVEEDGCFTIEYVDSFEDDWNESRKDSSVNDDGFNFMNTVRSVVEPLLLEHFNEGVIIEEIFKRYQKRIADCMAKEKTTLISLVACLKRKTK
ncbi:methyltransferase [Lithospermum erythrorhizon]|uniref:Methyltransferase n=1 Tax=Lithospermum erythrorhizon TaxID=34254 RepID=A0AAV3RA87_LITER